MLALLSRPNIKVETGPSPTTNTRNPARPGRRHNTTTASQKCLSVTRLRSLRNNPWFSKFKTIVVVVYVCTLSLLRKKFSRYLYVFVASTTNWADYSNFF